MNRVSSIRLQAGRLRRALPIAAVVACAALCAQPLLAQPKEALPQVTVTGTSSEPVEKSYRKMVRGMDYFERARAALAPDASLRFKLLPRKPGTDVDHIILELIATTFDYRVPVAADHTFVLTRDPKALQEDAVVSPNRKRLTMTWRTEIRTPGLPPDTRRLGDLRLECLVGLESGLISNLSLVARLADLFTDSKSYCGRKAARYLYFAERPLFSVTLVAGARREVLPTDRLYAAASDDPDFKSDLPFCDCEVLVDRTYFLPLGDPSWPDDTRVEFEYMDDSPGGPEPSPDGPGPVRTPAGQALTPQAAMELIAIGKSGKAEVAAALGSKAIVIPFDSGYEVWVYRWPGPDKTTRAATELVLLFEPSGLVKKLRLRPGYATVR
ncbi:hypothetical protein [Roseateles toxinivorans]|uniref:Outer membrane lipoprotein-sorting protein n=1 Tax=Roseateles toxinivorans TaxID=270368 RepID=A0A4V3CTJ3_9BURK|nr:hypothetical protein [Roseateles toxinivorans]TDP72534.1 hypothetical protein DES47_102279 [Roseateles toxinivorans]